MIIKCEGRKEFCNPIIKFQYITVPLFLGHDLHKHSLPSLFLQVIQESREVWSGRNTALQVGEVCVKSFLLARVGYRFCHGSSLSIFEGG